jgi:hypothetical protein
LHPIVNRPPHADEERTAITLLAINTLILGVLATPLTSVLRNIDDDERVLFVVGFGLTLLGAMVLVFPSTATLSGGSLPSRQRERRARASRALSAFGTLALAALFATRVLDAPP